MKAYQVVLKNPFLLPRNKEGFIDQEGIFKIVYTQLRQPIGVLNDLTVEEIYWLIEGHLEGQREHYEMIANAMKVAGASIMSGKDLKLFESPKEIIDKTNTVVSEDELREQRQQEIDYLEDKFRDL